MPRAGGLSPAGRRILLLTHLRNCGYVFNPVSFFYCSTTTTACCW